MDRDQPVHSLARAHDFLRAAGHQVAAAPDGTLLQVQVGPATYVMRALDHGWVAIAIPLGPTAELRPRAALAAALDIGAFADHQGLALLRQTLPLASVTFAQLEAVLAALLAQARALPGYLTRASRC